MLVLGRREGPPEGGSGGRDSVTCAGASDSAPPRGMLHVRGQAQHANAVPTVAISVAKLCLLLDLANMEV